MLPENCGAVTYDIVAKVVARYATTAETMAGTLFVSFFALCIYLGCYVICVLLYSYLIVLFQ